MNPCSSVLLTDLYQLTMVQAYVEQGMMDTAVFEFFVRRLPAQRGFLMAAGLEQVLDFLEQLHVSPAELEWLESDRTVQSIVPGLSGNPAVLRRRARHAGRNGVFSE